MSYSKADQMRFESYERAHLKKGQRELSPEEKIGILEKRDQSRLWFVGINVLAALFFAYSWYAEITSLGDTILTILLAVVLVNIGLNFYQRKQISELIAYLREQQSSPNS